jgi:hypothetical protein
MAKTRPPYKPEFRPLSSVTAAARPACAPRWARSATPTTMRCARASSPRWNASFSTGVRPPNRGKSMQRGQYAFRNAELGGNGEAPFIWTMLARGKRKAPVHPIVVTGASGIARGKLAAAGDPEADRASDGRPKSGALIVVVTVKGGKEMMVPRSRYIGAGAHAGLGQGGRLGRTNARRGPASLLRRSPADAASSSLLEHHERSRASFLPWTTKSPRRRTLQLWPTGRLWGMPRRSPANSKRLRASEPARSRALLDCWNGGHDRIGRRRYLCRSLSSLALMGGRELVTHLRHCTRPVSLCIGADDEAEDGTILQGGALGRGRGPTWRHKCGNAHQSNCRSRACKCPVI